jgi:hypothetical protein
MNFLSKSLMGGSVGTLATLAPWMAQESVQIRILFDDLVAHQYRHAARAVLVGAISTKHQSEECRTDGVVKLYVTKFTSECVDVIAGKLFEKALIPKMIREFATDVLFLGAPWQTVTTFEIDQRAVRAAFVGNSLNTFRHTLHTLRKEFAHRRYVHRVRCWMYMNPALSNEKAAKMLASRASAHPILRQYR